MNLKLEVFSINLTLFIYILKTSSQHSSISSTRHISFNWVQNYGKFYNVDIMPTVSNVDIFLKANAEIMERVDSFAIGI